jgi:hypothetical protein
LFGKQFVQRDRLLLPHHSSSRGVIIMKTSHSLKIQTINAGMVGGGSGGSGFKIETINAGMVGGGSGGSG